jgi:hypothetical protein
MQANQRYVRRVVPGLGEMVGHASGRLRKDISERSVAKELKLSMLPPNIIVPNVYLLRRAYFFSNHTAVGWSLLLLMMTPCCPAAPLTQ